MNKLDKKEIGNRFVELRGDRKQKDMCEILNIEQSQISRIESGHYLPSLKVINRLVEEENVSVDWLLYGESKSRYMRNRHIQEGSENYGTDVSFNIVAPEDVTEYMSQMDMDMFCSLPLLKDPLISREEITGDDIEEFVIIHRKHLFHPNQTICFRMPDESMKPIIKTGDICVIDCRSGFPEDCENKITAINKNGTAFVRIFHQGLKAYIFESYNDDYDPFSLPKDSTELLIGKLILWIGFQD